MGKVVGEVDLPIVKEKVGTINFIIDVRRQDEINDRGEENLPKIVNFGVPLIIEDHCLIHSQVLVDTIVKVSLIQLFKVPRKNREIVDGK